MKKLPKPEYTTEFKELAVKRVKDGQSNGVVAKELGLSDQTLRNSVKAFDAGKLNRLGAKTVTPEQMELSRPLSLRCLNVRPQPVSIHTGRAIPDGRFLSDLIRLGRLLNALR